MTTLNTFCPNCDVEVTANIIERPVCVTVKGDNVHIIERVAICPKCSFEIGDGRIESGNISRAYEQYEIDHDLVTAKQAKEIRARFGLSVREFSRFLGFGEQTYARYEAGSIPSQANSNIIKMAETPDGAQRLLAMNGSAISIPSQNMIKNAIANMTNYLAPSIDWLNIGPFESLEDRPLSEDNGYRSFDLNRAAALVYLLASKCTNFYKTKLQKAMFFCDFLSCERIGRSITGLTYAHANYGPVVDNGDFLIARLCRDGVIDMKEQGCGELVVPRNIVDVSFTDEELQVIDDVARCVNTFHSTGDISNYSHTLSCWKDTNSGEIIDYNHKFGEIEQAVQSRL